MSDFPGFPLQTENQPREDGLPGDFEVVSVQKSADFLVNEVAHPLFDLQDTSLQALDQAHYTIGDLQSQILLTYSGDEADELVFSRSLLSANRLGLNKFLQAFAPIPSVIATLATLEFQVWLSALHGGNSANVIYVFLCFFVHLGAILSVMMFAVLFQRSRGGNLPTGKSKFVSLLEPDHIAISPQGINLQWSSKYSNLMGLVLPWKRIALAYFEKHQTRSTGEYYQVLCLRDNLGKAMRLDCRKFNSELFVKALQRRAPWAVKEQSMALALQPVQQQRWLYIMQWLMSALAYTSRRRLYRELPARSGSSLKNNKYTILETMPDKVFGVEHIGLVLADRAEDRTDFFTLCRVVKDDGDEIDDTARVKLRQFHLPCHQSLQEWNWMLSHLETEVRRLSEVNSNNIARWLDVFVENGSIFVVTEYDAGQTLRQVLADVGPLPESRVRELALEMCEILIHMHSLDPPYVHKAFTPDSLVLSKGQFLKLHQFAIGWQMLPSRFYGLGLDRRYVPLELLREQPVAQSDIYALGGTLFFLLTGEDPKPFSQANARLLKSDVSPGFNELILKATQPAAFDRYASAVVVKEEILKLASAETNLLLL